MEPLDIGTKVENSGATADGRLSAAEMNLVVDKINEIVEEAITDDSLAAKPGYGEGKVFSVVSGVMRWATPSLSSIYQGASPATRTLNGITAGDDLSTKTHDELFEAILAPYTAPTMAVQSITGSSPYNEQNVVKSVTFRWTKNLGTPDYTGAQIQWRRGTSGSWSNLSTSVSGSGTSVGSTRDASASTATLNTGGPDNTVVQFQCIWTMGSKTETTPVATSGFDDYVASTKTNPTVGSTSRERGDTSTTASSTITRVSSNVAFGTYQWQVSVNGGSYADIAGATGSLTTSPQTVQVTHSAANTSDTVAYRVAITDAQGTTYSNGTTITFLYPYWYSVTSEDGTDISDADIIALSTTSPNVKELKNNNSRAKSLSNFGGGGNRIIYVGPNTAGTPSWTINGLPNTAFTTRRSNSPFTNSFGATWNIIVVVADNTSGSPINSVVIS